MREWPPAPRRSHPPRLRDEAQVLAAPEHTAVAHSLRAGLDIRKAGIKLLFAGSSVAALRQMFSRAAAPF